MDMTSTIEPKSDQLNSDDLITGPVTVTVTEGRVVGGEQPAVLQLAEYPGRPYKPSKSMRRVLVAAWGKEASAYAGKRLTLFRNPTIKFGGETVGGIEISHMSGLDKTLRIALTVTRGKKRMFTVEPLTEATPALAAPAFTAEDVQACTDVKQLQDWWGAADGDLRALIEARAAELKAAADG